MPFVCIRSVCPNAPSTTSALPPIRFCSAADPDEKFDGSTVRPSSSKYLRLIATKYATLFIWLTEPPTEIAMRGFFSFGACAAAGAVTKRLATASQTRRFIRSLPHVLVAESLAVQGRRYKQSAREFRVGE